MTVAQAARDWGVQGGYAVAPMGAGVCCRFTAGLSMPGANETRAGGTRTAPPGGHQTKAERDILKKALAYFAKEALDVRLR